MDVARLGLAVDSSQVEKGTVSLHQLTGAAGQASAAARQLAGASQAEAAGQKVATAATQAHTAALAAQNTVIRSSMQQRTMMIYQLNDVAVSLASGMNPAMVAMQQGSQILQGGLGPALRTIGDLAKNLVTRFWPLAAVVGAVGVAVAGLTHEINKASDVTVSFGDTAHAIWQLVSEGIYTFIQPAVELIGGWFATAWDWVVKATKDAGNWIIRTIVGSIEYVKTSVSTLPAAFVIAGQMAAQGLADAIAGGVNSVIGNLNSLSSAINQVAGQEVIGAIAPVNFGKIEFGGTAAQNSYNDAWKGYANTVGALNQRDIMGEMFGAISGRAQEIATTRKEMEELGGATKAANDDARSLGGTLTDAARAAQKEWEFYRGTFSSFFSDLKSGLQDGKSIWESFGLAASNALDNIANRLLGMASNGLFDMLFGGLFGGIGNSLGAGWGVAGGFGGTGIFGIPGMAEGGTVARGGLSWVGERGPELLRLPTGAQVIPNGPSMAMAANQNSPRGPVNVHIHGAGLSQEQMTSAISDALDYYDRKTLPSRVYELKNNQLVVNG